MSDEELLKNNLEVRNKKRYGYILANTTRRDYFYKKADGLGVSREFVDSLFEKEKEWKKMGHNRGFLDIGKYIRNKAYKPKPKEQVSVPPPVKPVRVQKRKQICTSQKHILCLKEFITDLEITECIRCRFLI